MSQNVTCQLLVSDFVLLQSLAMVAAGSNAEAESQFESSTHRPVAPTIWWIY